METDRFAHNPVTLLHIATVLRERGIGPVEIFRQLDISPLRLLDSQLWLPRALCFRLGAAASTVTGDPFFARWVGGRYDLAELGLWGRTIAAAETLRDACIAAGGGVGLLQQGTDLRFVEGDRHAELRFAYCGRLHADPRPHLIGTLAVLRKIALRAELPEGVGVRFSMPYRRGADRLEETHGSRLEFGRDHDAIVIDRALLDLPLGGAGAAVSRAALAPAETAAAVGALLKQLLPYRRANIDEVAARQGVSRRSLQRALRSWGFNFEELLDETRRSEALGRLGAGRESIAEIAFALGYADSAHFTRAFRRWTGLAPRGYLQACAEAAAGAAAHTAM